MKVYFGTPTHGAPRIEYVTGFVMMRDYEMTKPPGEGHWAFSNFENGPYIGRNRNELVRRMYERECEALMMVDHDVFCPPDTMSKLVKAMEETGAGVVAGDLILGNDAPTTAFFDQGEETGDPSKFAVARRPENGAHLAQCTCVATSTILIHRRVFDKISEHRDDPPWFGRGTWFMHWPVWDPKTHASASKGDGGGYWREVGEDFSFCKRAREVGEGILIHYDLGLQHHKVGRMVHDLRPAATAKA